MVESEPNRRVVTYIPDEMRYLREIFINPLHTGEREEQPLRTWAEYLSRVQDERGRWKCQGIWFDLRETTPETVEAEFGTGWSNPKSNWIRTQDEAPKKTLESIIRFIRPVILD